MFDEPVEPSDELSTPATPAGDLVRAWIAQHSLLQEPGDVIDVTATNATTRPLPAVKVAHGPPGRLENNLAREGVWAVHPDRHQQAFTLTTEDVQGSLLVEYRPWTMPSRRHSGATARGGFGRSSAWEPAPASSTLPRRPQTQGRRRRRAARYGSP